MSATARKSLTKRVMKVALSLKDEPFFKPLSKPVLLRIENLVYHREYESRQIVFFPGDLRDHVYWLREGRVKITRVSGDGRDLTYRHLFAGDMFGEECLVSDGRRDAYAEAMTRTVLCLMRADDFRRVASEEGEVSYLLSQLLCRRVIDVEHVLAETVFKTVRSRVASGLLRLYERSSEKESGSIRVTHQEVASLIGSTRETTTAVLHGLKKEGIVSIANRRITVLDPVALEHVARST